MTKKMKCPICQKAADDSILAVEYDSEIYAFCCPYCRERFLTEIERSESGLLDSKESIDD